MMLVGDMLWSYYTLALTPGAESCRGQFSCFPINSTNGMYLIVSVSEPMVVDI